MCWFICFPNHPWAFSWAALGSPAVRVFPLQSIKTLVAAQCCERITTEWTVEQITSSQFQSITASVCASRAAVDLKRVPTSLKLGCSCRWRREAQSIPVQACHQPPVCRWSRMIVPLIHPSIRWPHIRDVGKSKVTQNQCQYHVYYMRIFCISVFKILTMLLCIQ